MDAKPKPHCPTCGAEGDKLVYFGRQEPNPREGAKLPSETQAIKYHCKDCQRDFILAETTHEASIRSR